MRLESSRIFSTLCYRAYNDFPNEIGLEVGSGPFSDNISLVMSPTTPEAVQSPRSRADRNTGEDAGLIPRSFEVFLGAAIPLMMVNINGYY